MIKTIVLAEKDSEWACQALRCPEHGKWCVFLEAEEEREDFFCCTEHLIELIKQEDQLI